MKKLVFILVILLILSALSVYGADHPRGVGFAEISRPFVEAFGRPDMVRRDFVRKEGKIVYEARMWQWDEASYYVIFIRGDVPGWRIFKHGFVRWA